MNEYFQRLDDHASVMRLFARARVISTVVLPAKKAYSSQSFFLTCVLQIEQLL